MVYVYYVGVCVCVSGFRMAKGTIIIDVHLYTKRKTEGKSSFFFFLITLSFIYINTN